MDDLWLHASRILVGDALCAWRRPLVFCAISGHVFLVAALVPIDIGLEGKILRRPSPRPRRRGDRIALVACWGSVTVAHPDGAAARRRLHHLSPAIRWYSVVFHNIMAAVLTVLLGNAWFGRGGQTPDLLAGMRASSVGRSRTDGGAYSIPIVGPLLCQRHRVTICCLCRVHCGPFGWLLLYHTRFRAAAARGSRISEGGLHRRFRWLGLALSCRHRRGNSLCGFAPGPISPSHRTRVQP